MTSVYLPHENAHFLTHDSDCRKENPGHNLTLGRYTHSVLTLAEIVDTMSDKVCPELLASDDFCDVLTGKMTPLMFPYLFPDLDHAIYVERYNRSMVLSKENCAPIRGIHKLRHQNFRIFYPLRLSRHYTVKFMRPSLLCQVFHNHHLQSDNDICTIYGDTLTVTSVTHCTFTFHDRKAQSPKSV